MTLKQANEAIALLSAENIEKLLSPAQLKVWKYMQSRSEVTPKELSEALDIPRTTISQVLNRLMELKRVERLGLGQGTRYKMIEE